MNGKRSIALLLPIVVCGCICPVFAATPDGNVEWSGLFHDQGELFDSAPEPDSKTAPKLRMRAFSGDLTAASLKYFDTKDGAYHLLPMVREQSSPAGKFEYWQGTIPASASRKRYRFLLADGAKRVWYNALGPSDFEPDQGDFFVNPNFVTPAWLKNGVMYQIFPDRFYNGDARNDSPAAGSKSCGGETVARREWNGSPLPQPGEDRCFIFFGGDLRGINEKLDYVRTTLGADIVYLNPIFSAPSNHKYDTVDYDRVDPSFGTNEDLIQLSSALHRSINGRRGYLILDGVFNHTGWCHSWFDRFGVCSSSSAPASFGAYQSKNSRYQSFYNFSRWPQKYATFFDVKSLPKLNFGSPSVRDAVFGKDGIALRYLRAPFSIDGWRLDAPQYADKDGANGHDTFNHRIWYQFCQAVKRGNPNCAIIGEFWNNAASWTSGGEWDAATNFDGFTQPASQWITGRNIGNDPASLSASEFDKWLRLTRSHYPTNVQQCMSNHLSNHDITRFAERAGGDTAKLQLALVLQMTYVGMPTIYYGDEYGLLGGADPDDRRTFDWAHATTSDPSVNLAAKLIALRGKYSALRTGSFVTLLVDDHRNVFAFGRMDKKNRIAVVFNNDGIEHEIAVPVEKLDCGGSMRAALDEGGAAVPVINGQVIVKLPPRKAIVLVN